MTKCFFISAILTTAITLSAHASTDLGTQAVATDKICASDAGFYVGAYGGAQFDTDYGDNKQVVKTGGTKTDSNNSINSSWGGAGGIKVGYNFNSFPVSDALKLRLQPAVEAEALYIGGTSTSGFNGATALVGAVYTGGVLLSSGTPVNTSATSSASYNSAAGFVNGILRFKTPSIVTPYIGIGVGCEYITIHGEATGNIPNGTPQQLTGFNENSVDFAAQALAGFDVAIFKHISLFAEYKFIDALDTDARTNNVGGTGVDYRFKPDQIQQNLIVAGLKYNF